jgi:hypothetical protein
VTARPTRLGTPLRYLPLPVVLAALATLAWAAQASSRPACTAGVRTAGGVTYRTFCGAAHATIHVGGTTLVFSGGSCDRGAFTINIGTITLPPGKPRYRYFGTTVFTNRDGTYQNQAVSWQLPNGQRDSLFHATVVLKSGRSQGTFSGRTLRGDVKGTGSFHC